MAAAVKTVAILALLVAVCVGSDSPGPGPDSSTMARTGSGHVMEPVAPGVDGSEMGIREPPSEESAQKAGPNMEPLRVLYRDIIPSRSAEEYAEDIRAFDAALLSSGRHVSSQAARDILSDDASEELFVRVASVKPVDPKQLNALADHYGYKYANLKLMQDAIIAGVDDISGYAVEIPAFRGISHANVDALMQSILHCKMAPIETFETLLKGMSRDTESLIALGKRIAVQIESTRECVRSAVAGDDSSSAKMLEAIEAGLSREIDLDWLVPIREKGETMMVRSTGREDTEEVANAGGNASIANVRATVLDIFYALTEVVESYFMPKSIMQRAAAGDPYLYEVPRLSVMIQVMKGTKDSRFPYRSGVAYTREPGVKGTEISLIQGSYGHNEGVVTSAVAVDTYYVDVLSGRKTQVIVDKSMRMEPVGAGAFSKVTNDEGIRHLPALNNEMLRSLSAALEVIHRFYGGKVIRDVEYTVDPVSETVYILQARPLQQSATSARAPTYLPPEVVGEFPEDKVGKVSTIVAGSGSVIIFDKSNVISAGNLGAALSFWESLPSLKKKDIKVVFTAQPAPSTSHEAVEFRSKGCIVIQTLPSLRMKLRNHLQSPGHVLLLDPQQEFIVMLRDSPSETDAELGDEFVPVESPGGNVLAHAKQGWINYPISPIFSLDVSSGPDSWMHAALEKRDEYMADTVCPDMECLEMIKNPEEGQATRLKALRHFGTVHGYSALVLIDDYAGASIVDDDALMRQRLQAWLNAWGSACAMASAAIEADNNANVLFAVRVLDSLLLQHTVSHRAEDAWSLSDFVQQLNLEKKTYESVEKSGRTVYYGEAAYLLGIKGSMYTTNSRTRWIKFATTLLTSYHSDAATKFLGCLPHMHSYGVLIPWMNSIFLDQWDSDTEDKVDRVLASVNDVCGGDETATEALAILDTLKARMASVDPNSFATTKGVAENLPMVREQIFDVICGDDLTSYVEAVENPILYVAVLNAILEWVNRFDECIKAWTGNPENRSSAENKDDFYQMLEQNARIIGAYLPISTSREEKRVDVDYVISSIKTALEEHRSKAGPPSFIVTDNFAVGSAALYGPTHFDVQYKTDEELFTIIHQSMINLIATMMAEGVKPKVPRGNPRFMRIRMPRVIDEFYNYLTRVKGDSGYDALVTMTSIAGDPLEVTINIPLNAHSASTRMTYHPFKKSTVVDIEMRGTCDHCRWLYVKKAIDDFVSLNDWKGLIRSGGVGLTGTTKLQKQFTVLDSSQTCRIGMIHELVDVMVRAFASTNTGAYTTFGGGGVITASEIENAESISLAYRRMYEGADECVEAPTSLASGHPPQHYAHALVVQDVDPGYEGCACTYYNIANGKDPNHRLSEAERADFTQWTHDNLLPDLHCDGIFALPPSSRSSHSSPFDDDDDDDLF